MWCDDVTVKGCDDVKGVKAVGVVCNDKDGVGR